MKMLTRFCSSMTEASGLSIYDDHIIEIAAKVVGVPLSAVSQPSFSSLVHTLRTIPKKGIYNTQCHYLVYTCIVSLRTYTAVTEVTGITTVLLHHEKPLSKVLPQFFRWVHITVQEITEATSSPHFPGND